MANDEVLEIVGKGIPLREFKKGGKYHHLWQLVDPLSKKSKKVKRNTLKTVYAGPYKQVIMPFDEDIPNKIP